MAISGSSRRTTTSLVSAVIIAALTVGVWWLQDRSGEDDPAGRESPATATSATTTPSEAISSSGVIIGSTVPVEPSPTTTDTVSGLPYVSLGDLPPEAAATLRLIDEGGPFPYDQDGSTFHNFEGLLPGREDGYYREYTVETPGSDDRGARRIIGGAEGELYWTEDHYESFEVIRR